MDTMGNVTITRTTYCIFVLHTYTKGFDNTTFGRVGRLFDDNTPN